jgi:preprotein translocase subunit SecE
VSDEGDAANDAASDGRETQDAQDDSATSGGRTAVVTRPQRPTGKRSRQKPADAEDADDVESGAEDEGDKSAKGSQDKSAKAKKTPKAKQAGKAKKKTATRSANPITFIYNYLKQVVAEMRKVIWPSRRQMLTYTAVVLAFLAFMVTLVGLADFGLAKLVMLVFGKN